MTTPRRPSRPPAAPTQWATVTLLAGGTPAPVPVAPVQGTLALDLTTRPGPPETPELRAVPAPAPHPDDVRAWAARFAQAVVDVLAGDRPLSQLLRWTSHRVYGELDRRVQILARTSAVSRARTARPQVRSVHLCQPCPGAVEVSVHVRQGQRSRALAARLELRGGRWQCTALQLG